MAPPPGPAAVAGDPGDRAPAPALAASPVHRYPPLLLPDRGRSRPPSGWPRSPPHAGKAGRRFLQYLEDAGQEANPGLLRLALKLATGAGKTTVMAIADRLADRQRGAPATEPPVHAGIPDRHPRPHHQGPAAGAEAERPGQLLPRPRPRSERPAGRPGPGEDRHHQLPRLPAPGARRDREGRQVAPPGPWPRARHPGIRGPDAAAGDARAHGASRTSWC